MIFISRSIFVICDIFSKTVEVSIAKWLRKYEYNIKNYQDVDDLILADKYLKYLDMLLIDKVSEWFESDVNVIRLLVETDISFIQYTINQFKTRFCEKFSSKVIETSLVFFDFKLLKLRQKFDEFLTIYYKRVFNLMQRIDIKNRLFLVSAIVDLSTLKLVILIIILRAFVRDIFDYEVRKKVTRGLI